MTAASSSKPHGRSFLTCWFLPQTVRRALGVASIVAPVLVAINHAEAIAALDFTPRLLLKIGLTFLVPYAVSSYSSARALMQAERDGGASATRTRP
ncbi:MAG: nitrate/nitrite transporter NrtS [Candidatus Binatia bacterium]